MTEKVVVPYEHDSQDLTSIWMAVTPGSPRDSDWRPAYRDTVNGRRVVWVKYPTAPSGNVWVRDRHGQRLVERRQVVSSPAARRARARR